MKEYLGMSALEMKDVFEEWNKEVNSYLIEITAYIGESGRGNREAFGRRYLR